MPGHAGITQSYTDYRRSTVDLNMTVTPDKQDWVDATVAKLNGHVISTPQSRESWTTDPQLSVPLRQMIPHEKQRSNGGNLRYNNRDLYCGIRSNHRRISDRSSGLSVVDRIDKYREHDEEERDRVPYREVENTTEMSFDRHPDCLTSPSDSSANDGRFERRIITEQSGQQNHIDVKFRRRARTRDNGRCSDLRFDPRGTSSHGFTGQTNTDYFRRDNDTSHGRSNRTSKNTYVNLSKSRLHECNTVDTESVNHRKPYEKRYLPMVIKPGERCVQHRTDDLYNHASVGDTFVKYRSSNRTDNDQHRDRRLDAEHQESEMLRMASEIPEHQEVSFERNVPTIEIARDRPPHLHACSDFVFRCTPSRVNYSAERSQIFRNRPRRKTLKDNMDESAGNMEFDYFSDKPQMKEKHSNYAVENYFGTLSKESPVSSGIPKDCHYHHALLDVNSGDESDLFPISTDNTTAVRLESINRLPAPLSETPHTISDFDSTFIHPSAVTIESENNETEKYSLRNTNVNRPVTSEVIVSDSTDALYSETMYPGIPIEVNIITADTHIDCGDNKTMEFCSTGLKKGLQGEDLSYPTKQDLCTSDRSINPSMGGGNKSDVQGPAELSCFPVSPVPEFSSSEKDIFIDVRNEQTTSPALGTVKPSSCCSASSIKTAGSSSTAKSPFKVVYYQNRFISIPIGNRVGTSDDGVPAVVQCGEGVSRGLEDLELVKESSVNYDQGDTKARTTVSVNKSKSGGRLKYCLQRVVECLQDRDRTSVKHRTAKTERIPMGSHTARLVKFLNLSFMTTGLILFFGVFFVIMYTSLKKYFV